MPFPDISEAKYIGKQTVLGKSCHYFLHSEYDTKVHIYFEVETNIPVKLTVSSVKQNSDQTESTTDLLTYIYSNVILGPPSSSVFELPPQYSVSPTTLCDRQIGGFPYLHIFHYFVRF